MAEGDDIQNKLKALGAAHLAQEKFLVDRIRDIWEMIRGVNRGEENEEPGHAEEEGGQEENGRPNTRRQAISDLYRQLEENSSFFSRTILVEDEARVAQEKGPSMKDLQELCMAITTLRNVHQDLQQFLEQTHLHFGSKDDCDEYTHSEKRLHLLCVCNHRCLDKVVSYFAVKSGVAIARNDKSTGTLVKELLLAQARREEEVGNMDTKIDDFSHANEDLHNLTHCATLAEAAYSATKEMLDTVKNFTSTVYANQRVNIGDRSLKRKLFEELILTSDSDTDLAKRLAEELAWDEEFEQGEMAADCVSAIADAVVLVGEEQFGASAWCSAAARLKDDVLKMMREMRESESETPGGHA